MMSIIGSIALVISTFVCVSECQTGVVTNYCTSSQCQNGGSCEERVDGFVCDCKVGYTGIHCDIFDYCESAPCLHGGKCEATKTSYICDCKGTGYDGFTCHVPHDDCQPNPCLHGATCIDGVMNYTCNCVPGFAGKRCEVELSACVSDPCENGGTCLEVPAGTNPGQISPTFQCQCIEGIAGDYCQSNYNDCLENMCKHGTCVDGINDYTCDCTGSGYSGEYCDHMEVNQCSDHPCKNGATCVQNGPNYHCDCLPFHQGHITHGGRNCSVLLRGCENVHSCKNDAVCVPVLLNEIQNIHDFTCTCKPGFKGRFCDELTAMTISSGTYIRKTYQSDFKLRLRFRTGDQSGVIVYDRSGEDFVSVELVNGSLYLVSGNMSGIEETQEVITTASLSDSHWHSLVLDVSSNISLVLNDVLCNSTEDCTSSVKRTPSSYFKEFFIGHVTVASWLQDTLSKKGMTGCIEDVIFNSDSIIPTNYGIAEFHNTKMDCPACLPNTCEGIGRCSLSQTKLFECHCASQTVNGQCIAFPGVSCDFEKDMCGWRDNGRRSWTRQRGPTGSFGTGPDVDHTTGRGYYIYTESSGHTRETFLVRSAEFTVSSTACLTLWINMHGDSMGSLYVYQVVNGGKRQIVSLHGEQGTKWIQQKVTLVQADDTYLIIQGVMGSSYTSDMAVDDIQLTAGSC